MTISSRQLLLASLLAPAVLFSAAGQAAADGYVVYRSFTTVPPPAAPWEARVYGPVYTAPPSCRFAADFSGPAYAPQQGFVFQCWEPVGSGRPHRSVVRAKG